jgi:2'-5' RNA ligase
MAENNVRAFVAIELPEEIKELLWQIQDQLQRHPAAQKARWVDPFSAHITLKFLGDVPIGQLPALVDALDAVAERKEPITVQLGDLGAFPNINQPQVLFIDVLAGVEALSSLYNSVEAALKRLGFKPERREYHPHITLARVPRELDTGQKRALGDLIGPTEIPTFPAFTVNAISLMRSHLTPEGAIYDRLGRSGLGEAPPLQEDDWEDIDDEEDFELEEFDDPDSVGDETRDTDEPDDESFDDLPDSHNGNGST